MPMHNDRLICSRTLCASSNLDTYTYFYGTFEDVLYFYGKNSPTGNRT